MAITNPNSIKFANEQVRPLCEKARSLMAEIAAMSTDWFAGINVTFPNDGTALSDSRDAEGISRLTGANVNSAVGTLMAIAAASNSEIIALPCVRPLDAG